MKNSYCLRLKIFGSTTLRSTCPGGGLIEHLVVRELHMSPVPEEEIERKIGQSLARSRLDQLRA